MAIDRYTQGSRATLTSLHAPFVKACIKAKNYTYPLQFLDCDIQIIEKSVRKNHRTYKRKDS